MAKTFDLPATLTNQRWKAKIRDQERVEPPHVTLIRGTRAWRWGLRERVFLDSDPPAREVPNSLVQWLEEQITELIEAWDALYPENPVSSHD